MPEDRSKSARPASEAVQTAKNQAKQELPRLQALFPQSKPKLQNALELLARRSGYRDWNGYRAALERGEASPLAP